MGSRKNKLNVMKKNQPFSFKARARSFKYAFDGLKTFVTSEHNAWLHLVATIAVIVLSIATHIVRLEWMALIIVIGFVWVAELFNTAIEKIIDFISAEQQPKIKIIKDLSAAAVLVAAIIALITGCFIFIPKL